MNKLKKGLMGVLAASSLSGCVTANYDEEDISRIPRAQIERMQKLASNYPLNKSFKKDEILPYEEVLEMEERYGHLPQHKVNLYLPGKSKAETLDTTGPLNAYWDEIRDVENLLIENSGRVRLKVGDTDKDFVSSRSADNQLSTRSGLRGIDSYSNPGKNNKFSINVYERTGIDSDLDNEHNYQVKVSFGKEALSQIKEREDLVRVLETAEDAGVGAVVAGPGGVIGTAVYNGIDEIWGLIEGSNAPETSYFSHNRENFGNLAEKEADLVSTLSYAKETGANSIILVPYKVETETGTEKGIGTIYANNVTNVVVDGNTASFNTTRKGANHLMRLLYRASTEAALMGFSRYIDREGDSDINIVEKGEKFGGSRKGGSPGGVDPIDDSGAGSGGSGRGGSAGGR